MEDQLTLMWLTRTTQNSNKTQVKSCTGVHDAPVQAGDQREQLGRKSRGGQQSGGEPAVCPRSDDGCTTTG